MFTFIIILILIACFLLTLVVLAQNKSGNLSSQFGGSGASQLIGVKKTGDLLERLTWIFAVSIMVLSLSSNFFRESKKGGTSPNIKKAQDNTEMMAPPSPTDTAQKMIP